MPKFRLIFLCLFYLIFSLFILSCGKSKTPGQFSVTVEWEDEKPSVPCSVYAKVVKVSETEDDAVISQALPQSCDDTEPLDFKNIPNGNNYIVVVEVLTEDWVVDPFYYAGKSETFSLKPASHKRLSVLLSSTLASRTGLDISFQNESNGLITSPIANVLFELEPQRLAASDSRIKLIVANDPDFSKGREDKLLSQLEKTDNGYLLTQWNLDKDLCESPPCTEDSEELGDERTIYAKIIN